MANADPGSFNICEGQRLALVGVKRKDLDSTDFCSPSKVIKLADFSQVMQSRCVEYFAKRQNNWVVKSLVETNFFGQLLFTRRGLKGFFAVLKQLRKALRESENFLQYYSNRKVRTSVQFMHNFDVCTVERVLS